MKILILFYALAILNGAFFVYQTDMNQFIRENTFVKAVAEECAAGASLYYDEEALSEGYYIFNRKECEKYVRYQIEKNFPNPEEVSCEILYRDRPGESNPGIEVILTVKGRDRFRLPFLEKGVIRRAAYYEFADF